MSGGMPIKTVSTMEYGSKISSSKWGNVEIIKYLVSADLLPRKGAMPYIAGWSLVVVYDMMGIPMGTYARHTDKTMVVVDGVAFEDPMNSFPEISAKSDKTVTTNNTPLVGEPTTTEVRTYTNTYKGMGSATVPFPYSSTSGLVCTGLLTGSDKYVPKTEGTGVDKITTQILVPGAFKLDKIIGTTDDSLSLMGSDLIEGSISIAAGVVYDLNIYNPTI
jgi:hypothetical protein